MEWIWHSHRERYLWYKYTRQGILASLVSSPQSAKPRKRGRGNRQFFSGGCRHFPFFCFFPIPCSRENIPTHEQGFWNSAADCLALNRSHRSPPSSASVSAFFKTGTSGCFVSCSSLRQCTARGKRPVRCCEMGACQLPEEESRLTSQKTVSTDQSSKASEVM